MHAGRGGCGSEQLNPVYGVVAVIQLYKQHEATRKTTEVRTYKAPTLL